VRKSLSAAVAAVGVVAVVAAGFTPAAAADGPSTVFQGTVKIGSAPAKGVYVSLDSADALYEYGGGAQTDSSGAFSTDDVVAGTWVAEAYGDNILTTYSGNTVRRPDAKKFTVAAGKTTTWNISAVAAATVTGRVLDAHGHALKGLTVIAWNTTRAGSGQTTTDSKGRYVARGLATGPVKVAVATSDGTILATTKLNAKQGSTRTAHTLKVKAHSAKITGTVKVSGSKVTAQSVTLIGAGAYVSVKPSKSGKVTFTHLAAGTYTVAVDGTNLSKKVTVKAGKTKSFGTIKRGKPTTIKGVVKTSGKKPAAGAYVYVVDAKGTSAGDAVADSKGRYRIKGLISGKYTVWALPSGSKDYAVSVKITVTRGKNVAKNINLAKGSTVTGYVKHGSHGVAGANVTAGGASAVTDSHGKYTMTGVAPGRSTIVVEDPYTGGYHQVAKKVTVKKGKTLKVSTVKVR